MDRDDPLYKEWFRSRVNTARSVYSAYRVLEENSSEEELPDESSSFQRKCDFHGPDNKPSSRYYPREGRKHDRVICFKCKETWDSVALFGKFNGKSYSEALRIIEKRFHIKVSDKPEPVFSTLHKLPDDYISSAWNDVPRVLSMYEKKIINQKNSMSLIDYCSLMSSIDGIIFDINRELIDDEQKNARCNEFIQLYYRITDKPDDLKFDEHI